MFTSKKAYIFKIVIGLVFLSVLMNQGYGRIKLNGTHTAYAVSYSAFPFENPAKGNRLIGTFIEQGAGNFLSAHSDILKFSEMVEMSNINGADYKKQLTVLDRAIQNIRLAKNTYKVLVKTAAVTPYNQKVIAQLQHFDYDGFMNTYSLTPKIFNEVKGYLSTGDVTGTTRNVYLRMGEIENTLLAVRAQVAEGHIPVLNDIWHLNEQCANSLAFGQYVARVFYAIIGQ